MSLNPMLLQQILSGNNGDGDGDSASNILDMMQDNSSLNSKQQMLLQMIAGSNNSDAEYNEIDEDEYENTRLLRQHIDDLEEKLEEATEMIDVFAEAIGACSMCFGEKHDCPGCHGNGFSGWKKPDKKLFSYFILPALKHFKKKNIIRKKMNDNPDDSTNSEFFDLTVETKEGEDHV